MPWTRTEPKTTEKVGKRTCWMFKLTTLRPKFEAHTATALQIISIKTRARRLFGQADSQALGLANEMWTGFQPLPTPSLLCFCVVHKSQTTGLSTSQSEISKPEFPIWLVWV